MRQMNTKLAAGLGALSVAAAAIAVTAGTYAAFNSQAQTNPGQVQAGTLTVGVGAPAVADWTTAGNLAPGQQVRVSYPISNGGSLPGDLAITLVDNGSTSQPSLADVLQVSVSDDAQPVDVPGGSVVLTDLEHNLVSIPIGTLPAHTTTTVVITLTFPNGSSGHDNAYQGADTRFSVRAALSQH